MYDALKHTVIAMFTKFQESSSLVSAEDIGSYFQGVDCLISEASIPGQGSHVGGEREKKGTNRFSEENTRPSVKSSWAAESSRERKSLWVAPNTRNH